MKLYLNTPYNIVESFNPKPKKQLLDEIDEIQNSIDDNIGKEIKIPKDVLDSFKIKDTLNQELWEKDKLINKVRIQLMKIATDFYQNLDLKNKPKIKDIIFTGSLANFNWSKFSDIDLHIVLDFKEINTDTKIVEDYFYAQKSIWNQEHDIKIFEYPVELYVQDINHKLVATAVYSVAKDKWLLKPTRESFKIDKPKIKKKAEDFINELRTIKKDYENKLYQNVVNKTKKLKDKIKKMRNAGLEKGGELSLENIVFKTLRRTPFMDVLDNLKAKAYDNLMSLSEIKDINLIDENDGPFKVGGVLIIKGAPLEDGTQRLYITTTKNVINLDRLKKDNSKGQEAKMAILGNQIYRLGFHDGQLKAIGVAWTNTESMLKVLGLSNKDVALNDNKTPLHWETLKFNNIGKTINNLKPQILNYPNIRWVK